MDPDQEFLTFLGQCEGFLQENTGGPQALPIPKTEFVRFVDPNRSSTMTFTVPNLVEKHVVTSIGKYRKESESFYRTMASLQKDIEAFRAGKPRKGLAPDPSIQIKKCQEEEWKPKIEADQKHAAMQALKSKIEMAKQFLDAQKLKVEVRTFISESLGELYDVFLESGERKGVQFYAEIKNHVTLKMFDECEKIAGNTKKQFTSREAKKEEWQTKKREQMAKNEEFIRNYPNASLCMFLRELEARVLAVVRAEKGKQVEAYNAARKGQLFTALEEATYELKDELKQQGLPYPESRSQVFILAEGGPRKTRSSSKTRDPGKPRSRTASRTRTPSAGRPRSSSRGRKPHPGRKPSSTRKPTPARVAFRQNSRGSSKPRSKGSSRSASRSSSKPRPGKGKGNGKGKGKQRGRERR